MRSKILMPWITVFAVITAFSITGCSSLPAAVPYTYTDAGDKTAVIHFNSTKNNGIRIIDYSGVQVPVPKNGTRWDPMVVPAEKQVFIKVNVYDRGRYSNMQGFSNGFIDGLINLVGVIATIELYRATVNRDVYFKCPPLEAGKQYNLVFKNRSIRRNSIELWESGTRILVYEQLL